MKKPTLTLLALLALTLTGCSPKSDSDFAGHITEFNYKGHRYLRYYESYGNGAVGGITHNPDCPCREKGGGNE